MKTYQAATPFADTAHSHLVGGQAGFRAQTLWPAVVVSVRGSEAVLEQFAEVVGVSLPPVTESAQGGNTGFLRIGPDSALLVQAPIQDTGQDTGQNTGQATGQDTGQGIGATGEALEAQCEAALSAGAHGQATDLSNERVLVALGGAEFTTVMAQFCPLDFDSLPVGTATGTVVAQIPAVLHHSEDSDLPWRCIMRRSYARWFLNLVRETARPYGVVID